MPEEPKRDEVRVDKGLTDEAQREITCLAYVIHEINNPLTAIMAHLEVLRADREDDPVVAHHLAVVMPQIHRLVAILDTASAYANGANDTIARIDPGESLRTVAALFEYHYRSSGVEIQLDIPHALPTIIGNAAHLQQAWLNYFNNAFNAIRKKETGAGKISVKIMLNMALHQVIVEIADDGVGMDAATLRAVMRSSRSAAPEQQWIGTTEASRIIAEHGGTAEISSTYGRGTTVRIAFPIAETLRSQP